MICNLSESNKFNILTLNLRKNPNSDSGKTIAERDYGINVSWKWIEDFSPYPTAGLYQKYWTVNGAFSNPTIILINQNQSIVGLYHVYCLGMGKIDGIQSAESLSQDVESIQNGTWKSYISDDFGESITFIGIFGLGILTALTPCSIALLVAMISYVGSLQKKNEKENSKLKKISIQGLWIGIVFTLGIHISDPAVDYQAFIIKKIQSKFYFVLIEILYQLIQLQFHSSGTDVLHDDIISRGMSHTG